MEPDDSLLHSQVHATYPYPEPAQSSPYTHNPLPEDPFDFKNCYKIYARSVNCKLTIFASAHIYVCVCVYIYI